MFKYQVLLHVSAVITAIIRYYTYKYLKYCTINSQEIKRDSSFFTTAILIKKPDITD